MAQSVIEMDLNNGVLTKLHGPDCVSRPPVMTDPFPGWCKETGGQTLFYGYLDNVVTKTLTADSGLSVQFRRDWITIDLPSTKPGGPVASVQVRLRAVAITPTFSSGSFGPEYTRWAAGNAPNCNRPFVGAISWEKKLLVTMQPLGEDACRITPVDAGPQAETAIFGGNGVALMGFVEVRLPRTSLSLPDGVYATTHYFNVGAGADIDLGNHGTTRAPVNLKLKVVSDLKVFAPFRQVVLSPRNNDWKGVRDGDEITSVKVPLFIQARGPFSIRRVCSGGWTRCELIGQRGPHRVGMGIDVEFGAPGVFRELQTGAFVSRDKLIIWNYMPNAEPTNVGTRFEPSRLGAMEGYVRFSARAFGDVLWQIRTGGIRYTGTVTLMFDKLLD